MSIGLMGSDGFDPNEIESIAPSYFGTILHLWDYSKFIVNGYRSGKIEFLRKQCF